MSYTLSTSSGAIEGLLSLYREYGNRVLQHSEEITHRQKKITILDYSNLGEEEFVNVAIHNTNEIVRQDRRDLLLVIDVSNVAVTREAMGVCRKYAPVIKPYTKKIAVFSIPGILASFISFLVEFFSIDIKIFETKDAALDWIVEDDVTCVGNNSGSAPS